MIDPQTCSKCSIYVRVNLLALFWGELCCAINGGVLIKWSCLCSEMSELSFVFVFPTAMPTITSVTTHTQVTLGSDAVLTCSHNGNPIPSTVAWFKDGELIRGGPKYSVSTVSGTVNTLTIHNVQPADLTNYQCHLSNKRGSDVVEIFICGQRKDMHVWHLVR